MFSSCVWMPLYTLLNAAYTEEVKYPMQLVLNAGLICPFVLD